MNRLLLIDAYAMIYRAYYAFMQHPRVTTDGRNTSAIYGFLITLDDLIRKTHPTHVAVAFDPKGGTFRHEAYPAYKAQRQATPEDIHAAVPIIKDILRAMNISTYEVAGFEADDVIGTLSVMADKAGFSVLMATPDKDYGQLTTDNVHIYRPRHNGGFEEMGPQEVCDKYGLENQHQVIDLLALMGDQSDNIPGCKGVGEKTAVKLLQEFHSIDNLLSHTDQLQGATKQKVESQTEQIRFSHFLAKIRTDVPIEFNADEMLCREPNIEQLRPIYQELEFRSLLKKFDNAAVSTTTNTTASKPTNTPEPSSTIQPDLFSATAVETYSPTELTAINAPITDGLPSENIQQIALAIVQDKTTQQQDLFSALEEDKIVIYIYTGKGDVFRCQNCEAAKAILEDEGIRKIGYELKNAYKLLAKHGISLNGELFDVSVAHYLLQSEQHHEIEYLSEIYLKATCDGSAENIAVASWRLHEALAPMLTDMPELATTEMQLIPVLAEMEMAGVRFDKRVLKEASARLTEELRQIEQEIIAIAGADININSPKQVGDFLFDTLRLDPKAKRTKSGQYVTSEEVLQSLSDRHPIVGKILDYRALKKLLSTYIDALPMLIDSKTGKIHTTYNQTITATGRLSSSNPNLQNLPIRSERGRDIRRAVIADEGCTFLSADYSQIELRLMAHFSGDEHLIEAFKQGQDVHAATAAKIFGVPIEEVTKDMRRRAKTANFGIIYGISAFGLAEQLGSSRSEAKQLIDDYFNSFPGVMQYIEQQKQIARQQGYATTLLKRKRYLPDINSRNPTVRSFSERNAVNAPIQGTAADIIKVAMVRIFQRLKHENLRTKMVMQVHDELNFNVPASELSRVYEIVVGEMENALSLTVPLVADCHNGNNWLEAH